MLRLERPLRFAFLNNEAHPVGRLMLSKLYAQGIDPVVIIEERSPFALMKTTAYERCLQPEEIPPPAFVLAQRRDTPFLIVDNLNSKECEEVLSEQKFDLLILGNVRVLKPKIFGQAKYGCINVHPGLLPEIRGSFPQCWSVLNDVPLGCTCHLVDEGVDTGPILLREGIEIQEGDTLERIVGKTMSLSAKLVEEVMLKITSTGIEPVHQLPGGAKAFRWPEPETIAIARERLATGAFSHFKRAPKIAAN